MPRNPISHKTCRGQMLRDLISQRKNLLGRNDILSGEVLARTQLSTKQTRPSRGYHLHYRPPLLYLPTSIHYVYTSARLEMQTLASGAIHILFEDGLIPANLVLISTRLLITFVVAYRLRYTTYTRVPDLKCKLLLAGLFTSSLRTA